jgi:hypothetical protein
MFDIVGISQEVTMLLNQSVTSPDHPQVGECHSKEISHALKLVGNIPNIKQAEPCYSRECFHSLTTEHMVTYPIFK